MWEVVENRRRDQRFKTHLIFSVALSEREADDSDASHQTTLVGHTRDISASGLALIVPSIHLSQRPITDGDHTLRVLLDLPAGRTEMEIAPVRHEPLNENDPDAGYLIGASIAQAKDSERARFVKYLHTLS